VVSSSLTLTGDSLAKGLNEQQIDGITQAVAVQAGVKDASMVRVTSVEYTVKSTVELVGVLQSELDTNQTLRAIFGEAIANVHGSPVSQIRLNEPAALGSNSMAPKRRRNLLQVSGSTSAASSLEYSMVFANNPGAAADAKEEMLLNKNGTTASKLLDGLQARGLPVSTVRASEPQLAVEVKVHILVDNAQNIADVTSTLASAMSSGALEANIITATSIPGQESLKVKAGPLTVQMPAAAVGTSTPPSPSPPPVSPLTEQRPSPILPVSATSGATRFPFSHYWATIALLTLIIGVEVDF